MISICIPIYNFDVSQLVKQLSEQAEIAGISYEILLIDDASDDQFKKINEQIIVPHLRYISLENNIGRSRIRNLLAEKSLYPYLIFMDCDAAIPSADYIKKYSPYCQPGMVCYGGRSYEKTIPPHNQYLHWLYGSNRESLPAEKRSKNSNYSFCTNNFLIDKNILMSIRFNELLEGYGHEDTLMGIDLLKKGIFIQHIDNPLIHIGLEDSNSYLNKIENGLSNLKRVEEILESDNSSKIVFSQIVKRKKQLQHLHLKKAIACLFRLFSTSLRKQLLGKKPSLFLFDIYRLGYYCNLTND